MMGASIISLCRSAARVQKRRIADRGRDTAADVVEERKKQGAPRKHAAEAGTTRYDALEKLLREAGRVVKAMNQMTY
jgi:hypothetical protein